MSEARAVTATTNISSANTAAADNATAVAILQDAENLVTSIQGTMQPPAAIALSAASVVATILDGVCSKLVKEHGALTTTASGMQYVTVVL